jgi:hypothetical protein
LSSWGEDSPPKKTLVGRLATKNISGKILGKEKGLGVLFCQIGQIMPAEPFLGKAFRPSL